MSLSRKLDRNRKKTFFKEFKKKMRSLEKIVRCTVCDRVPNVIMGEKIDEWRMEKKGESFRLTCPECVEANNVE